MSHRASHLIDQLHRAIDGHPWHGPSVMALLQPVTAEEADVHPIDGAHSIAEITAHLTAWTTEVTRRLDGFPPGDPPEGDWPPSMAAMPGGWAAMTLALAAAVAHLQKTIAGFPATRWDVPVADPDEVDPASPVTFEDLIHGLAQHYAYHGGQVALLRKALADKVRG